jgi:serine/threonine protein kinase
VHETGPLQAGDCIGDYEVLGLLGRGGSAFVYAGRDLPRDRRVAVKVIVAPGERGRDVVRRARREAPRLLELAHPNIVRYLDGGVLGDTDVYFVMELVEGRTLRELLRTLGRLSASELVTIVSGIAEGVEAAHRAGVIHRDLKPENVFVARDEAIKVADFGIAKILGGDDTAQADVIYGTLPYMAPEQLQGFGATARSDVFALGVIAHELVSGTPPCMAGVARPTVARLIRAQLNDVPRPLSEVDPRIPRRVARIVQRMLAKEAAQRWGSMREVATAFRQAWEQEGVTPRVGSNGAPRRGKSALRVALAAGGVGAALAAAAGYGWTSGARAARERPPSPPPSAASSESRARADSTPVATDGGATTERTPSPVPRPAAPAPAPASVPSSPREASPRALPKGGLDGVPAPAEPRSERRAIY